MTQDYSKQENITKTTIPVKGHSSDKFSIRVDRIKFLDDDTKNEIDVRVWSNTGRPSRRGCRMTIEQAIQVQTAIGLIIDDLNKEGNDDGKDTTD